MNRITNDIAKRLKQGLDADKAAWERGHAAREAAVQAEAEKQERDRIAIAKAEAEAEERRKTREAADRLERLMGMGNLPDVGESANERQEWLDRTGASYAAVARAASDSTPHDLLLTSDDLTFVRDGHRYRAGENYIAAVRALHYWSNDLLTREGRVAEAARRNQRQGVLDKLADEAVAAWEHNKQLEDSLENG